MPFKYKVFPPRNEKKKKETNGDCDIKTSYGALHTSGMKTAEEILQTQQGRPAAQSHVRLQVTKIQKPSNVGQTRLLCECEGGKKNTRLTSPLKSVNWSYLKINIPIDRGHWLLEIASVRVWVLGSWAPLGCPCHFVRMITGRVVPAWAPSASERLLLFAFALPFPPSGRVAFALSVWHLISDVNYISLSEENPTGLIFQHHTMKELQWQTM